MFLNNLSNYNVLLFTTQMVLPVSCTINLFLNLQEDMYLEEVSIDARIHPRIIGARGRGINKLMEDFNVELRFPRSGDPDPNLVTISGVEDNVLDCKDYLLNMEEEYVIIIFNLLYTFLNLLS